MENISRELKEQMINQRLEQYRHQLFSLEMNRVAFEATGEQGALEDTLTQIENVKAAYRAVEGMLNETA